MADSNPMQALEQELVRFKRASLWSAVNDADRVLDMLVKAREQAEEHFSASANAQHRLSLTMAQLQNHVTSGFEAINSHLKEVSKGQRAFGKALDKNFPLRPLPTEIDAIAEHPSLVNRAVAMHLLREGQFKVASSFLRESNDYPPPQTSSTSLSHDIQSLQSKELQDKFATMYAILHELKNRNLIPAIEWAKENSAELEARGSNIEFELTKLQFIWLFKGPSVNGLPDDERNGPSGALTYAQAHFPRFQARHRPEVQRLFCALLYAPNIPDSPYAPFFTPPTVFDDVATSFTREFCSLIGMSAESPLYLAVTAGAIALPQLLKYTTYMREKRTEWTSANELAFETPLPASMIYHPIFVCPVSKDQTTETNPPMILPCGHVICKDSLQQLAKSSRFKCPYCPQEGYVRDALQIRL